MVSRLPGLSIKGKLFTLVVGIVAFVIGLGLFALWQVRRLSESIVALEAQADKATRVADLQIAIGEAIMPGNDFIITRDRRYAEAFPRLDAEVKRIGQGLLGTEGLTAGDRAALERGLAHYVGVGQMSARIFAADSAQSDLGALMERMDYEYAAPAIDAVQGLREALGAQLAAARRKAEQARSFARTTLIVVVLALAAAALVLVNAISRSITKPLGETTSMLRSIAEGTGDLTRRLRATSRDELGTLGSLFNRFVEGLQGMVREIMGTSAEISRSSTSLQRVSAQVSEATARQLTSLGEIASSTEELRATSRSIESDAAGLVSFSSRVAATSDRLSTAIGVVAEQSERLDTSADGAAASIGEIAASIRQISAGTRTLLEQTDSVATSTEQLRASILNVQNAAQEQSRLSDHAQHETTTLGLEAARRAGESMARIETETAATAESMRRVRGRSEEIGDIVTVIDDISDTTKLLALNAAILAAQAGAAGVGFKVVAEEIKKLSERTKASTAEIAQRIDEVRREIRVAADSATRVSASVAEGAALSREAEGVLGGIVESSTSSLALARRIENAITEQTGALGGILARIRAINEMTERIALSTAEQEAAAGAILQGTQEIREATGTLRTVSAEQARESRDLAQGTREAAAGVESISRAAAEQRLAVEHIAERVASVRDGAEANRASTEEFARLVSVMQEQGLTLRKNVASFQVG